MFCLLDSEVEPKVWSERPGLFELEELAMVLKPTSVLKPKVVSKLSELAGSWAPASESLDDMFHFIFFSVFSVTQ